jgi:hypothetical protein
VAAEVAEGRRTDAAPGRAVVEGRRTAALFFAVEAVFFLAGGVVAPDAVAMSMPKATVKPKK